MGFAWRAVVLVAVFAGVGMETAKLVVEHAVNAGAAESQVRLAGAMAGLFGGGAAAVLVGIAMVWGRGRRGE